MADPVRHDGSPRAGGRVSVQVVGISRLAGLVVDREVPHEDARRRARHAFQARPGALETLKDDFEQLPLLRVHVCGLEVVDAEEVVVELAYVFVDKVAAGHISAAAVVATFGVIETIDVVSPRRDWPLS